jgi:hypothetical protein
VAQLTNAMKLDWNEKSIRQEEGMGKMIMQMPFDNECCVLKKCCKKYKKKGRHCKSCPKL